MKRFAMLAVGAMAVVGCVLCIDGWLYGPSCANTPREMFEGVLLKPVPDGTSDIQGVGDMGPSYTIWLRFRATDSAIAEIIADGFIPVPWSEAETHFQLPSGYDRFSPRWSPHDAGMKECYRAGRACPWSLSGGQQWLLIDRKSGTAYAYAEGG